MSALRKSQKTNKFLYKIFLSKSDYKKAKYYAVIIYWQDYFNRLLNEIEKNDCWINCEIYYDEFVRRC